MSKQDAHTLLDWARAGGAVPTQQITEALAMTGDLSAWRASQTPVETLPSELETA